MNQLKLLPNRQYIVLFQWEWEKLLEASASVSSPCCSWEPPLCLHVPLGEGAHLLCCKIPGYHLRPQSALQNGLGLLVGLATAAWRWAAP